MGGRFGFIFPNFGEQQDTKKKRKKTDQAEHRERLFNYGPPISRNVQGNARDFKADGQVKKKQHKNWGAKNKEEKEEEEDGPSRNRRGVQRRPRGRHTRPHRKGATRKNVSIILYNVLFFMSGAYSNRFYRWFRPSFLLLVLFFFYFGRFRYIVATAQCRMRAPFFFCSFVRVPSFTEFCRVLPSVTECYGFIPSFIELYRVLSNLTEFYRVLPSFFLFGPVSPRGRRRFIVL